MFEFFQNHKKQCIIAAVISVIVFAVYLFLLFKTGYWYRDIFLYKQKAPFEGIEVYSGKDTKNDARYEMTMAKDGIKTYIAFTVNETERNYEIVSDNSESYNPKVTIYENGELIFTGTHAGFILLTEDGEYFEDPVKIIPSYAYPLPEEELFPSYNWLCDVSRQRTAIRGNAIFLPAIIMIAAVVIFDMMHPDFFWQMRNCLDVEGGRPSDYFSFVQKLGWKISPFIIIALMIASFVIEV